MLKRILLSFAVVSALGLMIVPAIHAAGSQDTATTAKSAPKDADYDMAKKAVKSQDWNQAIALLTKVVGRDGKNANAHNYLGFSYRKSGNHDAALNYYKLALKINPKHKGAHEYIGEAYLEKGNLQMAEQHLKALDSLCFFGCQELNDLKKAVGAYKKKNNISS